ncbi:MAG: hypothetical protein E6I48_17335 [Chloroflexi bacterium]|nr:MAG: hypothetical protein E6I48_17335 [Chloroflexota bacterium]
MPVVLAEQEHHHRTGWDRAHRRRRPRRSAPSAEGPGSSGEGDRRRRRASDRRVQLQVHQSAGGHRTGAAEGAGRIYSIYAKALAGVPGIRLPGFDLAHGETPLWTDAVVDRRDDLDRWLSDRAMGCRRFWFPIHTQAPYRRADAEFPVATRVAPKALWLPSAFTITDDDVAAVCESIVSFLKT